MSRKCIGLCECCISKRVLWSKSNKICNFLCICFKPSTLYSTRTLIYPTASFVVLCSASARQWFVDTLVSWCPGCGSDVEADQLFSMSAQQQERGYVPPVEGAYPLPREGGCVAPAPLRRKKGCEENKQGLLTRYGLLTTHTR